MRKTELGFWSIFVLTLITAFVGRSVTLGTEAIHALLDALVVSISAHIIKVVNKRDGVYTYGLHRLEVLSALLNIFTVIMGSTLGAAFAAIFLLNRVTDNPYILLLSSLVSLFISVLVVKSGEDEDKNTGILFHAFEDSLAYLIGAVTGLAIVFTKYYFLDPIAAISTIPVILFFSVGVLKNSYYVFMERSPVNVNEVKRDLNPIFKEIDDIHVWNLCDHIRIATLHVRENPDITLSELDKKREMAEDILKKKFDITHVTIQFESNILHEHEF